MACINAIPMNENDFGGKLIKDGVPEEEITVLTAEINDTGTMLPDVLANGGDIRTSDGCVRSLLVEKPEATGEHIGFNLTRSQWDPYPWVRTVDENSAACRSGLKEGDCLLRVESQDLLGLKVTDVAKLVRGAQREVRLLVWSSGPLTDWDPDSLFCGPIPGALRRLGACLGAVLRASECPVCQATVAPPATQCPRGHLLCSVCCKSLTVCPLCRATMPAKPLRNLLADEVYNSVVDAFELHGSSNNKSSGSLTQRLFGDAKIIKTDRRRDDGHAGNHTNHDTGSERGNNDTSSRASADTRRRRQEGVDVFDAHDGPGRGIKWGTHRLLQRLLPGRARSTGNIARGGHSPTRSSITVDDSVLSRSLSTLDITRAGDSVQNHHAGSNSLNSLACTAGGSCGSLPPVVYVSAPDGDQEDIPAFIDEESSTSSRITTSSVKTSASQVAKVGYFCPADAACDEILTDDVQQHILQCHRLHVTLIPDQQINLSPEDLKNGTKHCQALLHPAGQWFYPKCERDESENGVRVWCWALASSSISSDYQIEVEVWPKEEFYKNEQKKMDLHQIKTENRLSYNEEKCQIIPPNDGGLNFKEIHKNKSQNEDILSDLDEKNDLYVKSDFGVILVEEEDKIRTNSDIIDSSNKYISENNNYSCKNVQNINISSKMDETDMPVSKKTNPTSKSRIFGPLLKYAAPVLSLKTASWSKVLASRQALFLGDSLLANDAWVKLSVEKIE